MDAWEEKLMWIAVFLQAVCDYQKPVRSMAEVRERRELLKWFRSLDTKVVGSFGWICEAVLDLEPKEAWRKIKRRAPHVDFGDVFNSVRRSRFYAGSDEAAA